MRFRPLAREEDRCGESALDRFLQQYVGPNQFKLKLSATYVAALAEQRWIRDVGRGQP